MNETGRDSHRRLRWPDIDGEGLMNSPCRKLFLIGQGPSITLGLKRPLLHYTDLRPVSLTIFVRSLNSVERRLAVIPMLAIRSQRFLHSTAVVPCTEM